MTMRDSELEGIPPQSLGNNTGGNRQGFRMPQVKMAKFSGISLDSHYKECMEFTAM